MKFNNYNDEDDYERSTPLSSPTSSLSQQDNRDDFKNDKPFYDAKAIMDDNCCDFETADARYEASIVSQVQTDLAFESWEQQMASELAQPIMRFPEDYPPTEEEMQAFFENVVLPAERKLAQDELDHTCVKASIVHTVQTQLAVSLSGSLDEKLAEALILIEILEARKKAETRKEDKARSLQFVENAKALQNATHAAGAARFEAKQASYNAKGKTQGLATKAKNEAMAKLVKAEKKAELRAKIEADRIKIAAVLQATPKTVLVSVDELTGVASVDEPEEVFSTPVVEIDYKIVETPKPTVKLIETKAADAKAADAKPAETPTVKPVNTPIVSAPKKAAEPRMPSLVETIPVGVSPVETKTPVNRPVENRAAVDRSKPWAPCKFGAKCTRSTCSFAHKVEDIPECNRSKCRFNSRCNNEKCEYWHAGETAEMWAKRMGLPPPRQTKPASKLETPIQSRPTTIAPWASLSQSQFPMLK